MKWNRGRIIESIVYFGFFYLIIGLVSPTIVGFATIGIALFNILRNPKDIVSNYILLFIPSIFYNSLDGQIFLREFNRNESSVAFATAANWLGILYLVQLLFTGQLNLSKYKWQKLDSLLLLLLITFLLSALMGYDSKTSLNEFKRYPSFIAFYIITRITVINMGRIQEILSVFYATIGIVFFIAIQKVVLGSQYGALVDFIFLLAPVVHLSLQSRVKWSFSQIAQLFMLAIGSLSLLISDSRRVLMSIVIIWFSAFKLRRIFSMTLLFLIPGFFFYQLVDFGSDFRYQKSITQLGEIITDEGRNSENELKSLTTGRSVLWAAGVNLILDNPVLGVGLDNHITLLPKYGGYTEIRIHNVFLDTTAQSGIIGLTLFLLILINLLGELRGLKRNFRLYNLHQARNLSNSLYISFISVIIFSFFGGSMLLGKWGWFQVAFISAVCIVLKNDLRKYQMQNLGNKGVKDDEGEVD